MGGSKKTRVVRSSVGSIGMGVGVPQVSPSFDETRSNLVAEGKTSFDRSLYNIVQYVFQCSKHNKVAITPIANTGGIIWIPYAVLPNDLTWEESSEHGLKYFFGQFTEVDTVDGRRAVIEGNGVMPRYEMNIIELLRVQLPSERVEVRLTISVKLFQTEGFKCCQDTRNLQWENYSTFFESTSSTLGKFWSAELKNYGRVLKHGETRYIYEFSIEDVMSYFNRPDRKNSIYGSLLKATAINHEKIMALYESYLFHCSPAFSMSEESFGRFLAKFGFDRHSVTFKDFYRAACFNRSKDESMKWFEFLFSIICIDPKTKAHEARHRLMFRMADKTGTGNLTKAEFIQMAASVGLTNSRLTELHAFDRFTSDTITEDNFARWMRDCSPPEFDRFCRSPKSILDSMVLKAKAENATSKNAGSGKGKKSKMASRLGRGTCDRCRAQDFKYCMHCVLIDERGHCSKITRASNKVDVEIDKNKEMDVERYSAEIRFGVNSTAAFLFEHIITYRGHLPADDMDLYFEHMTYLLECTKEIFAAESRLLKTNAPLVVVGELRGNVDAALAVQQLLTPLAPVHTTNLIFLGNYIDKERKGANIALLCLLFSLKIQDPDKVLLLRGFTENGKMATFILQPQCEELFGLERGRKMMELLLQTFERMPFAVVIEDMIFAAHSGLSVSNPLLMRLLDIPVTLRHIEDCPIAYELISKVPTPKNSHLPSVNQYTKESLATFLQVNSLSTFIRSAGGGGVSGQQSALPTGNDFEVFFDGNCLSVSSCSTSVTTVCYVDPGKKLECSKVEDIPPSIQFVRLNTHSVSN